MRALIVDDEPFARKVLREELEFLDSMEVVGEAENGQDALSKISLMRPDIVFLDIQMPVMGGFELLDHLKGGFLPVVVMVTAFDRHAIQAFEAGALDYLLKPISQQRLQQSVERARRIAQDRVQVAENIANLQEFSALEGQRPSRPRKIVGRLGEEYFLLGLNEVLAFQADGDLVWIVTPKQKYLATQSLRRLEERLRGTAFRRIHRNALVNIEEVRKMSMLTSQRWLVTLNNGQEFIVSKRLAKNVRDVLHW
jgi:two-component system, LytTR family, response regulator